MDPAPPVVAHVEELLIPANATPRISSSAVDVALLVQYPEGSVCGPDKVLDATTVTVPPLQISTGDAVEDVMIGFGFTVKFNVAVVAHNNPLF